MIGITQLKTWWRHRWLDADDARQRLPAPVQQRLTEAVAASEQTHTGEIRLCIEGGLPVSYLWRQWRNGEGMDSIVRQRALMMFGKLGVWDTEHNNGVLVYLLLAERRIELVADRALARQCTSEQWQALVQKWSVPLQQNRFEEGLMRCVQDLSELLETHFPVPPSAAPGAHPNQLADAPVFF